MFPALVSQLKSLKGDMPRLFCQESNGTCRKDEARTQDGGHDGGPGHYMGSVFCSLFSDSDTTGWVTERISSIKTRATYSQRLFQNK